MGLITASSRRHHRSQTVVVGDDHVQADVVGVLHLKHRANAAVDGDDQVSAFGFQLGQGLDVQAVPFIDAVGDVRPYQIPVYPQAAQRLRQQHSAGHAVGIKITVDDDRFFVINRLFNAGNGFVHVWQQKGIGRFQVMPFQKSLNVARLDDAPVVEHLEHNGVDMA